MIKILKSLAIITAVVAIAGGGTYAYFSDKETRDNNTFASGDIDITLTNDNGEYLMPFTVQNWAPGDESSLIINIKNTGSLEAIINAGSILGSWDRNGGFAHIGLDLYYDNNGSWVPINTLSSYPKIPANGNLRIKAVVKFLPTAGNAYEKDVFRGSFSVLATQPANTDFSVE